METHYYGVTSAESQNLSFYNNCKLFKDYVKYLLDNEGHLGEGIPFLTDCFTDISRRYSPFLFAWLDLPLDSKSSK